MFHLVLLLAVTALLSSTCKSANIDRQMELLSEIDNNESNEVQVKQATTRKMLTLTHRPPAVAPHAAGSVLTLTCDAIGTPAPSVHWFKNDAPVYEYDIESNELTDSSTSVARISSSLLVTQSGDQDVYTCLVSSGSKTLRATTVVYSTDVSTDLSERARLLPLAPRIVSSYRVYMDTMGRAARLPCRPRARPRARLAWRDPRGRPAAADPRLKVLKSGTLVISALQWSDMGTWSCHVSNAFGEQTAKTFIYPAKAG